MVQNGFYKISKPLHMILFTFYTLFLIDIVPGKAEPFVAPTDKKRSQQMDRYAS